MVTVEYDAGLEDVYLIDTNFLGHRSHVAACFLDAENPTLIDTGSSRTVDVVLEGLETLGVKPAEVECILLSHPHLDHAGGAGYLLEHCPNAEVLAHPGAIPYLSDEEKIQTLLGGVSRAVGELAEGYGDLTAIPEDRVRPVDGGEVLDLGDRTLEVFEASGHSNHQLVFYEPTEDFLYTADEVGMWLDGSMLPATPPPNFNYESNRASLTSFLEMEPEWLVFPHFGVCGTPREVLEEYDRVLAGWVESIRESYRQLGDREAVVETMIDQNPKHFELWDETTARQTIETDTMGVLLYLDNQEKST